MNENLVRFRQVARNALPARVRDGGWQRWGLFAANFLRQPRAVGTLFPSSRCLVRRTLRAIRWEDCNVCVEYGPGTGKFTGDILSRLRSDAALVCIDVSLDFVRYLRCVHRDDRLHLAQTSAVCVREVLQRLGLPSADVIISGIPFRPLPGKLAREIVDETYRALSNEGSLHVYQVSTAVLPHLRAVFGSVVREFEPFNILPTHLFRCFK